MARRTAGLVPGGPAVAIFTGSGEAAVVSLMTRGGILLMAAPMFHGQAGTPVKPERTGR